MISSGLKEDLVAGLKRLRAAVNLRDALVFGGIGAATYGISMVSLPGAWVFSGLTLFWLGVR